MQGTTNGAIPSIDQSKDLLHRVASSSQLQKSKRLRELLLYLGERALRDPNCTLREQEVGVDVLGRPQNYDTSHDTLVRVLVSHLRKKLQEHFAGEGREEPLVIEIPKGSYLPVFRPRSHENGHAPLGSREALAPEQVDEAPQTVPQPRGKRLVIAIAMAVAISAAVGWALGYTSSRGARRGPPPSVQAFWNQLFGSGQATYLVLSDVNLLDFEMLIGGPVPLSEYEAHEWESLAEQHIQDPVRREFALEFSSRVTTAMSDVQVARDFGLLASDLRLPLSIINARDMSSPLISSMNTILLGSWRANPWVGLFEEQMAFQATYQESPPSFRFVNRSPRPGEEAFYAAEWRRTGYCRITFVPNPRHTGNVLLITGSDVISPEAGAQFITSEESIGQLRQKLGVLPGRPLPHFEVLLRTQIVNSTVPRFEMVAYRPH
ncbi:MAG TPA: hypothetical protein VML19_01710 [Verrucomicrobiae bacterium]|nr:hypothetical protein [Verrucomicrobiae bacterium]